MRQVANTTKLQPASRMASRSPAQRSCRASCIWTRPLPPALRTWLIPTYAMWRALSDATSVRIAASIACDLKREVGGQLDTIVLADMVMHAVQVTNSQATNL